MADRLARELAGQLPDEPRWLETRALLLSGRAEIIGGRALESGFVARVLQDALSVVAVVGRPPAEAIVRAADGVTAMTPIFAQTDNTEHVGRALAEAPGPRWTGEPAILHRLRHSPPEPARPSPNLEIRLLHRDDSLDHLPAGLRHEMSHAREMAPVAGVFVNRLAASFCYPCFRSETLWDVSIDTLEEHRGKSLGERAVAFMIDRMRREGREPVWGALESNAASLRLAAKLGFVPCDAIVCFSRGPWAFLTACFDEK